MLGLLIIGMAGGLELRTSDVVGLWVASGDEYGSTQELVNAGGVYKPP